MGMLDELLKGPDGLNGFPFHFPNYGVDIVICIDATRSMEPIIDEVKEKALYFCSRLHESMEAIGKNICSFRIKVITFRDYRFDGPEAMIESDFFVMPAQNEALRNYVRGIRAMGGGNEPGNALEALALAIRSPWTSEGEKHRHVILFFTDTSAASLGDPARTSNPAYPAGMPSSLAELGDMWAGTSRDLPGMPEEKSARFVLYAPDVSPWTDIQIWNNTWFSFPQAGAGLEYEDFNIVIRLVTGDVF